MFHERPLQLFTLALLVALGWILWPEASVVLVAGYTVLVAERPFSGLVGSLRGRRSLAAFVATSITSLLLLLPIGATAVLAIGESLEAWQGLDRAFQKLGGIEGLTARLPAGLRAMVPTLTRSFMEAAVGLLSRLSEIAPKLLSSAGWLLADLFLTVVTIYYLFKEGPRFVELVRRLIPLPAAQTAAFLEEFHQVALGLFWGSLVMVAFHGVTSSLGYWIFGVHPVVLLGSITAVAAFIPLVGTAVVWLPLVVGLWLEAHPYRALGLLVWGTVIVGAGDNLLRPFVSRGHMAIPKLLLFLTLFGGLQLLGAKGVLLGPLIGSLAATAMNLLADRLERPSP